jgi:hypothetical protein
MMIEVGANGEEHKNEEEKEGALEGEFQVSFSWESSNHFMVIFNQDGSVMFIYKNPNMVPDDMRKLIYV